MLFTAFTAPLVLALAGRITADRVECIPLDGRTPATPKQCEGLRLVEWFPTTTTSYTVPPRDYRGTKVTDCMVTVNNLNCDREITWVFNNDVFKQMIRDCISFNMDAVYITDDNVHVCMSHHELNPVGLFDLGECK